MVPRIGRRRPRTTGPSATIRPSLVSLALAEPPHPRTGDPHFRGESRRRDGEPTPSPTAHLAGQAGCFEVRGVPAVIQPIARVGARSGAISPSTSSAAIGVGVTLALVTVAAADDRATRRPRADRPGRARRRAVRRQPPGAFAGRFGPRSPAPAGADPRHRRRVAPARCSSCRSPPVMVAVAIVFWLSLSFGGPFHLRLWGAMYPARLRGRVVGVARDGPRRRRRARRVRRRRHRRPARRAAGRRPRRRSSGSPARSAYAGLRAPAAERPPSLLGPRLDPGAPRAAGPARGSPWPRASTAAA